MAEKSGIEWTRSTFNPWIGCTKVSPGCDHCYAEVATPSRTMQIVWGAGQQRHRTTAANWNQVRKWNEQAKASGEFWPVFTASLADIFDNEVPDEWRADYWKLVKECEHLTFLVLTKRIGNVKRMLPPDWGDGYANVRLGISVVNQDEADRDIPKLLMTPARVRWLSMEPLLERVVIPEVFLKRLHFDGEDYNYPDNAGMIDWVVVGGESGTHARPMHPDWVRSLRDQCEEASVPFLFKQWGEWAPYDRAHVDGSKLQTVDSFDEPMTRYGKKLAGRMLDGRLHDGYPQDMPCAS